MISFVIYTYIKFAKLSVPSCNKYKLFFLDYVIVRTVFSFSTNTYFLIYPKSMSITFIIRKYFIF